MEEIKWNALKEANHPHMSMTEGDSSSVERRLDGGGNYLIVFEDN